MKLFFLFIGLVVGFVSALFLVLNFSRDFYLVAIPSLATLFGAFFVVWQVGMAGKAIKITAMPALKFILKSGKTFYGQKNGKPTLAERLFTRIIVKNDSSFIIFCLIKIVLTVKYKNGKTYIFKYELRKKKNPWVIFVGMTLESPQYDLLSRSLLGKKHSSLVAEDEKKFNQQKREIGEISAEFIISAGPFVEDSLKFQFKPLRWTFDLDEEVWLDPHQAKDYNIKI